MKFAEYIGSQFGRPRGVVGKMCCLIMNVINKAMYLKVVEGLSLQEASRVLDIGYGNGYLVNKIYKQSRAYIEGIDISGDMKIKATKKNRQGVAEGKIHLEIGDCCEMTYQDETFDVVTTVNTIYFWQDTKKGMDEIYRVLKVGGVFKQAVYSKAWLERLAYTKKGFKLFEITKLEELAKDAGFSRVEIEENKHMYIISCYKA